MNRDLAVKMIRRANREGLEGRHLDIKAVDKLIQTVALDHWTGDDESQKILLSK